MGDYTKILNLIDEFIKNLESQEFDIKLRLHTDYTSDDIQTMVLTAKVLRNIVNAEMIKEMAEIGLEMEKNAKY